LKSMHNPLLIEENHFEKNADNVMYIRVKSEEVN
jgi:hypothetical protein